MSKAFRKIVALIAAHFGQVPYAVKGFVNAEELLRSLATALGSGSLVGVALVVLGAVNSNIAAIIPNPVFASIASFAIVHVLDLLRRLQHDTPTPKAVAEFLDSQPGSVS